MPAIVAEFGRNCAGLSGLHAGLPVAISEGEGAVVPVKNVREGWVRTRFAGFPGFQMRVTCYEQPVTFEHLHVWMDPVNRPGPEAMAVDEWLLDHVRLPVLRIYGWLGDWGSLGYFGSLGDATASFPGVSWVRRWTGGGTVDHRADWTYTVVAPAGEPLADMRGDGSYRMIHAVLAAALTEEGITARLSSGDEETGASMCFENPVNHDLVGADGRKLAGAGQRRSRHGLLHQGSVAAFCDLETSRLRGTRLASGLAKHWKFKDFSPQEDRIAEMVAARYAGSQWTNRR